MCAIGGLISRSLIVSNCSDKHFPSTFVFFCSHNYNKAFTANDATAAFFSSNWLFMAIITFRLETFIIYAENPITLSPAVLPNSALLITFFIFTISLCVRCGDRCVRSYIFISYLVITYTHTPFTPCILDFAHSHPARILSKSAHLTANIP